MLGGLEVLEGTNRVDLGPRKQRALLAVLLLAEGQAVSADRLVDAVWGDEPPSRVEASLHAYLSGLRRVVEPTRGPREAPSVLVTRDAGYALLVERNAVDLWRFGDLVEEGRHRLDSGDLTQAEITLRTTLAMYAPLLPELEHERFVLAVARRTESLHSTALELSYEVRLGLGDHQMLVPELETSIARYPLHEGLWAQLALARYRNGRQSDALRAIAECRRTLAEATGVGPGTRLRELEADILAQAPHLDPPVIGSTRVHLDTANAGESTIAAMDAMVDASDFGHHLRVFRQRAALTQETLAERARMTAKAVSALERGERRRPYPSTVRALCDALELSEADRAVLTGAVPLRPAPSKAWAGSLRTSSIQSPTSMIGREAELDQLLSMVTSGAHRLITITGPGGVGKTRLVSAFTAAASESGVQCVLVELAPVRASDLVLPTIALSFGLQVGTADPIDAIAAVLGDNPTVLVLDNMEHVIEAAPVVAELIARCPVLVLLVTSRSPLRIRAEQEFPLGPLAVPPVGSAAAIVDRSPAARMFAERARSVSPTFAIDDRNATAVASICARLDGLPLALELAATHLRYLSAPQLLERLDQAITTPTWRDGPERHQTLTSTLEWSYELLTDAERQLLGAVAVFAGGFELDALAHVAEGDPLRPLNGLVEQSLVLAIDSAGIDDRRFRMLEPVRSYAMSLQSDAERQHLASRHAEFYADMGIRAHLGLQGPEQTACLDRLGREHANLRACLATLLADGQFARAAELGGATWLYWALRGHAGEGIIWWERVLHEATSHGVKHHEVAMAHLALAGLRLATADITAVAEPALAAADAGRRTGDQRLQAEALGIAATAAAFAGDSVSAAAHLEEAANLQITSEDGYIGSHALLVRSQLRMMEGDRALCRAMLDEAEEMARSSAGPFTLAMVLNVQSTLAQLDGDADRSLERSTAAARTAAGAGVVWTLVYTLPMLAMHAASRGHHELAVALFAASSVTAESSSLAVVFRPDRELTDGYLDTLRNELSADDFHRAWEWGRSLGIDDVVDLIPSISEAPEPW